MNTDIHTIDDVALIFEGGGMRASYTSAVAVKLIEEGIRFTHVYGVSAGSSCAVNYASQDMLRSKQSFVDFALDPRFGGMGSFLAHRGMFNAHYIYQESCYPHAALPFDMASFLDNPADVCIESFQRDTGQTVFWHKKDLMTLPDLMVRVRASSTLPGLMPSPEIDGRRYYDGGLGEGAGIPVEQARRDGFDRFFIVRTRPHDYRKTPGNNALIKTLFWRRPHVVEAVISRPERYNACLDEVERLERSGAAYVFYSESMCVESGTTDVERLQRNYDLGRTQAQREFPAWADFLNL